MVDGVFGATAYADDLRAGHPDLDATPDRAHPARRRHPPIDVRCLVVLREALGTHGAYVSKRSAVARSLLG